MNILITGAFGFVGTNLSNSLSSAVDSRLIALDVAEAVSHEYNEYHSWDILEKINGKDIDAIIHLAGKAHDTKNTSEEKVYFDINVGLTEKIFEFFLKSNASKFIFFSSVKAAADSVEGNHLTEHAEPKPGTPYGKSKLEGERYIEKRLAEWESARGREGEEAKGRELVTERGGEGAKGRKGEEEICLERERRKDKKVYILRPCMIHGPGNKGNLNLLYKIVSKGIPWPLGAYHNKRSFTSVDNLNFIIKRIIDSDVEPGTYHIADDEPVSTNRLIQLIAESKGEKARIWEPGKSIINGLARIGDLLHLPLNSERLKKLTESYVVSNEKLKQALGVEKLPVSAEEGLRRTLESFNK